MTTLSGAVAAVAGCSALDGGKRAESVERADYTDGPDWPMAARGPRRTGHVPTDVSVGDADASRIGSMAVSEPGSIAVVGESIFGSDGALSSMATDGTAGWDVEISPNAHSTPAVANGHVYATTAGTTLAATMDGGDVRWRIDAGHPRADPVVVDRTLYVATLTTDGLLALDVDDGSRRWSHSPSGRVVGVAADDRRVYLATDDGTVRALDRDGGDVSWTYRTAGALRTAPVVGPDRVFVGSTDGTVTALDRGGERVWQRRLSLGRDGVAVAGLSTDGRRVYVPSNNGETTSALDAATGTTAWRLDAGLVQSPIGVADDAVLVGSANDGVHAVTPTDGERLARFDVGGILAAGPVIVDGAAYAVAGDGAVYAID